LLGFYEKQKSSELCLCFDCNYFICVAYIGMSLLRHICHQRKERCFVFLGKVMPICSRCFGIYISSFFCLLMLYFCDFSFSKGFILFVFVLFNIPLIIDGGCQYFNLRDSNNLLRFFTGVLAGIGSSFVVYYLIFI
jgi:uncharacterized membrane protein